MAVLLPENGAYRILISFSMRMLEQGVSGTPSGRRGFRAFADGGGRRILCVRLPDAEQVAHW